MAQHTHKIRLVYRYRFSPSLDLGILPSIMIINIYTGSNIQAGRKEACVNCVINFTAIISYGTALKIVGKLKPSLGRHGRKKL